jgi:hypothetical protein
MKFQIYLLVVVIITSEHYVTGYPHDNNNENFDLRELEDSPQLDLEKFEVRRGKYSYVYPLLLLCV